MCVIFMTNYFLVGGDVPVDSDALLMTDFMNFKIKLAQFFGCAHSNKVCVRIFIGVSAHTYINICICIMFLKKEFVRLGLI
jgi:hypothetical protein